MAIYMKLGSAKGDVTETGHKDQIELLDVQWSMSRTIRSTVGIGKNREATSAYVSEVSVTKYVDSASSTITQNAFAADAQDCSIDFTRADKGQEAIFSTITLKNTIISGLVNSGTSADRPTEALTLNFTEIEIKDFPESSSGQKGSPKNVTYDLTTAKAS